MRRRDTDLTPTQAAMVRAIRALARDGYPPSIDELAAHLHYASKNSVTTVLARLRRKGVVAWQDGARRTLRVVAP